MEYYHGSKEKNLKVLKVKHNKDNKVYVTSNKLVALVYASREYVNLFVTNKKDNVIEFLEYKPNLFQKLYKGKEGYIYILENKDYEKVDRGNNCSMIDAYCVNEDVNVIDAIKVDNVYDEFLNYEKEGKFRLIKYENMDEKSIDVIKNNLKKVIEKHKDDKEYMNYIKLYFNDLLN